MKTWENYKVDSINRLPGRAHFSSFPSKETALLCLLYTSDAADEHIVV